MYKAIISIGYVCLGLSGHAELEQLCVDQTVSVVNIILAGMMWLCTLVHTLKFQPQSSLNKHQILGLPKMSSTANDGNLNANAKSSNINSTNSLQ